jgi:type IX secretion system PorP/SprF family membrane protein
MRMTISGLPMLLALMLGSFLATAQQRPYYTQYVMNPFISNPALAGIENYWDLRFSYRNQWNGISGAPQTIYATGNGPLKIQAKGAQTTSTVHSRSNKATRDQKRTTRAAPHGGIGFGLISDRAGPIEVYTVKAAYAYHINLNKETSLSAGLEVGAQGIHIRSDQLNFGTTNPIDPAVNNTTETSTVKPDIGAGVWLYSASYFVGISAHNVVPVEVDYSEEMDGRLVTHSSIIAGYKFYLSNTINFIPSAMIRYVHRAPFNFDINAKFQYLQVAWVGASYRHSDNFAAMVGMNISSSLSFGYSFDITTSRLKNNSNGSHEVIIGILFGKRSRVILSPRNFW